MIRRSLLGVFLACAMLSLASTAAAADRLDRLRELATARGDSVADDEAVATANRKISALMDEEVIENLQAGGVFASRAFLQDRLDGLAESGGGVSVRLLPVGRLLVATVHLGDTPSGHSVRVYGPVGGDTQLLSALSRLGRPAVHALPIAGDGGAQFLVAWEGASSGRGTNAMQFDVARQRGDKIVLIWSTAPLYPNGLIARSYRVQGSEFAVRYELHYPGWIPGCELQTEQEDRYRLAPGQTTLTRVKRTVHNDWHQALHVSASGIFGALAARDRGALAALVPNARLREKLPVRLAPEPACDAPDGANPTAVSVAAIADERRPWTLTFRRAGNRWHLTSAAPVIE